MGTSLLYIKCRVDHFYGYVEFKYNDIKSLYPNNILSEGGLSAYIGIAKYIIIILYSMYISIKVIYFTNSNSA